MEREHQTTRRKLIVIASADYPAVSEISVSFPDQWEYLQSISLGNSPVYLAAMPPSRLQPQRDRFFGLSAEINVELTAYRLYRLFQPWPMPQLTIRWDYLNEKGQVESVDDLKLRLEPVGQAQAWIGQTAGVLWECYLFERANERDRLDELVNFWRVVESDMGVVKIYTPPHEPTFQNNYQDFLYQLGFRADPEHTSWWLKTISQDPL